MFTLLELLAGISFLKSADPSPSHGRGGAWDHLWCGPWLFPIYAPIASIAIPLAIRANAPRYHLYCTPPWAHRTLQTLPGSASALDRLQFAIPPTPPLAHSIYYIHLIVDA